MGSVNTEDSYATVLPLLTPPGVCTSGLHEDLITSDRIAQEVLERLMANTKDPRVLQQYADNLEWIRSVEQHKLVVGSEARILYSNAEVPSIHGLSFLCFMHVILVLPDRAALRSRKPLVKLSPPSAYARPSCSRVTTMM